MLKICGVFLLAASAAMILAETKEKYAKLLCICAGILAAFAALALLVPMISTLQELTAESTAGPAGASVPAPGGANAERRHPP